LHFELVLTVKVAHNGQGLAMGWHLKFVCLNRSRIMLICLCWF